MTVYEEFVTLYEEMKQKMPIVRNLCLKQLETAAPEEQYACLIWLQSVYNTTYFRYLDIKRDLTEEQWERRRKMFPFLEEVILLKQREKDLRLVFEHTCPQVLIKQRKKEHEAKEKPTTKIAAACPDSSNV